MASCALRTAGSSVANSESSTSTCAPVSRFSRLDLPALVYPAIATDGTECRRRWPRCTSRPTDISRDLAAQPGDPRPDPAPVSLDLRLARAAGADAAGPARPAAGLPGQRLAPAAQPGQQVLQLGELDLRLALLAAGVLGEDVQDQRGPVDDLDLDRAFQAAQLARGQLAVADDGVGARARRRSRPVPWPCPRRRRSRRPDVRAAGRGRRAPPSPRSRPAGTAPAASSRPSASVPSVQTPIRTTRSSRSARYSTSLTSWSSVDSPATRRSACRSSRSSWPSSDSGSGKARAELSPEFRIIVR